MDTLTTNHTELLYRIALTMIPRIGAVTAQNLIAYCGSAEGVFRANKAKLMRVPLVGEERAESIIHNDILAAAQREVTFIEANGITPIFHTDPEYPTRLRECPDMPLMLYYQGNIDLNAYHTLAIVGTRRVTTYGKDMTKKIVQALADKNILIVSGLAYGIDIAAHQAAIEYHIPTLGVLGHGLHTIYPPAHHATAKKMTTQGGLLTEYTSQVEMSPHLFPMRNRIVAGMCDATLVIESAVKGGALITAHVANTYNREVFAVPGRANDTYSAGCNYLIRTFKATMIETGEQLLDEMNWQSKTARAAQQQLLPLSLNPAEQSIYELLQAAQDLDIDSIVTRCNMNPPEIANTLLEMEMNNLIVSLPGKRYKLVAS